MLDRHSLPSTAKPWEGELKCSEAVKPGQWVCYLISPSFSIAYGPR